MPIKGLKVTINLVFQGGINMAIEGVKNVQAAGYQASQTTGKAVVVSAGTPVQAEKVTNENGSVTGYDTCKEASTEQIKKAVSEINKRMTNTLCQFGVHEGTGRITIKILDGETKDVIKEFPTEESLEMIQKAWELSGILVDEKR